MIAQLKNKIDEKVIEENKKAETKAYYFAGIEDVFPAIAHHEKSREIKLLLYKRLRNGLAHMSFTGINIYLNDDIQEPYLILDDEDLHIVISPRYWTYAIFTHFTNYMAELKNPDSVYRDNFRKRILRAT